MASSTHAEARRWRNADRLDSVEPTLSSLVEKLDGYAKSIPSVVTELPWSGRSRSAAVVAAERQGAQMGQAATALDDLRSKIIAVGDQMGRLANRLTVDADALENDSYAVDGGTWQVTDTLDYALMRVMSNDDPLVGQLENERAEEAVNETIRLQGLARELASADQQGADSVRRALGTLASMTPIVAGIYPGAGAADFKAIADGTATPAQITRAGRAMNLTDDQLAALNAGRPVVLSPEQATYVREFLSAQRGRSLTELAEFGDKLPAALRGDAKGVLANSLQVGSNPNISGTGHDGTRFKGGLNAVPASVQAVIKRDNAKELIEHPGGTALSDIRALNQILGHGSDNVRAGTDVDRGLYKQAALIGGEDLGIYDADVSRMLQIASTDRPAAHSFLTGSGMSAVMPDGEEFDHRKALEGLIDNSWEPGTDAGIRAVLDEIGNDSTAESVAERRMAGIDARIVAQNIVDDSGDLMSLGQREAGVLASLENALSPYASSMVGVPDSLTGTAGFNSLRSGDDLAKVFAVMDGDHDVAVEFNRSVSSQVSQLNELYAQAVVNGEHRGELGLYAGRLDAAMSLGIHEQAEFQFKEAEDRAGFVNSVYNAVVGGSGAIVSAAGPGGVVAGAGILTAGPLLQEDIVGGAPSRNEFGADGQKILELNNAGEDTRRYYSLLEAMTQAGRISADTVEYEEYFDENGELLTYEEISSGGDGVGLLSRLYGLVSPLAPKEFEDSWDNGHNSNWGVR